jgi:acyl carrier protein
MAEDITQRVINVIAKNQHIDPSTVHAASTFEELGIDSLDGLQILFALEEEFDIDIPDDAGKEFRSVAQVVEGVGMLLEKKQAAASNPA